MAGGGGGDSGVRACREGLIKGDCKNWQGWEVRRARSGRGEEAEMEGKWGGWG